MMTRRDGVQQKMLCVTLESLMPQEHFLRRLDSLMDFSFIYQRVESLYSHRGRPSIDPVVVVKMLLLGYLYGIDSERRLEQEVRVNIAYRWFLGIDLDEPVPDHSTFSQLRRRKFNGAALFEELFEEVVRKCIEHGLIDGKLLLTDSTHVRANARNDVVERVIVEAEPSAYLQRLNEQAVKDGVYPKRRKEKKKAYKELVKSPVDPDAGFMKRTGKPLGFYYLSHQTCDARYGLITDVYTTPGNVLDSTVHSERIKRQIVTFGFRPEAVCADSAYDSSEIHKDMLDMGIRTYIPKRNLPKPASGVFSEADFIYDRESDTLTCLSSSEAMCRTSNGLKTTSPTGLRTATMLLRSIGAPPTKDLQPATAPAHYRFSLLSYPNVRLSRCFNLRKSNAAMRVSVYNLHVRA